MRKCEVIFEQALNMNVKERKPGIKAVFELKSIRKNNLNKIRSQEIVGKLQQSLITQITIRLHRLISLRLINPKNAFKTVTESVAQIVADEWQSHIEAFFPLE